MAGNNNKDNDKTGHELFMNAMRDVKPLHNDRVMPYRRSLKPVPRQRFLEDEAIRRDMLSEDYDPAQLETGEELAFLRPGIQHGLLHKLRRGQYSVQKELDLHGMTVREAREQIGDFLHYCCYKQMRCVRIIHGKGYGSWHKQPILKGKVNYWLQQRDEVLAFCSARQVDGGTGAIYVLIRRG